MTQFVAQWLRARVVFLKNRVEVDARKIDVTSAAARRRFYLDRALRKNSGGAGSDMAFFMAVTAHEEWRRRMIERTLGDIAAFLIGAHAASAYPPERMTKDINYFVVADRYATAIARLEVAAGNVFAISSFRRQNSDWSGVSGRRPMTVWKLIS